MLAENEKGSRFGKDGEERAWCRARVPLLPRDVSTQIGKRHPEAET